MTTRDKPIDVVFDCMIFLQAVANRKSLAARLLDFVDTGELRLFVSRQILKEVRDVLSRPEVRESLPGITDESVEALFARLKKKATLMRKVPKTFDYSHRDPKDEPYINLAIAADANYLVSRDTDLLDLMRWDTEDGRGFQRRFRGLRILDPLGFIKLVTKETDV
ncbi:MAG TPA: putative toxin-antitoxin system toxin component, PIN family [Blastocatellia bacterium]|nr:putative toxin-antitoxin system toxin component, PIN family [Blastocatellia bacterium]